MTIDAVGNAHYTDVLKYDPGFFKTAGIDLDRYPMLLSRRYERQATVREIQDFHATLDRENATVTLTFDKPGFAYNMGSYWLVPFFPAGPAFELEGAKVFEQESTVSNEFTLWQDADFKTTTHLELPAAAKNVRWDETKEAMLYDLAYIPPAPPGNALQRNRTASVIVFALLIVASLGAAALLYRSARPAPSLAAPTATPSHGTPSPARKTPVVPDPGGGEGTENAAPTESPVVAHYCAACGAQLSAEDHFCRDCGHHIA